MAPRSDRLATVARLRRLETDLGRQRLASRMARLHAAEARAAAADAAVLVERETGAPADYGEWLARGLAERERATLSLRPAEADAAEARAGLVSARVAERALDALRTQRARSEAKRVARRADRALDDLVAGALRLRS